MPNIDLVCIDCQKSFYFSERDQAFFKDKNFTTPKRCYQCRQRRKEERVSGTAAPRPTSERNGNLRQEDSDD